MTNAEHLIENVIFGMKEGKPALEIIQEEQNQHMLNDENTGITAEEVVAIACHIVWGLYDGQFPDSELTVGEEVLDPLDTVCVITHTNEKSIHVLYSNGKTHRFPRGTKFMPTGVYYDSVGELIRALKRSRDELTRITP